MSWAQVTESLSMLSALSPMPSDRTLLDDSDDLADRYDAVIENISQQIAQENPRPEEEAELVRVLADSFGLGGGMGIYWGTLHLIEKCTPRLAYPIIQDRVINGLPGSRYWCCFILGRRRSIEDLPLFLTLLGDDVPEVQKHALQSLEMLSQKHPVRHILPKIRPLLQHPDSQVARAAQATMQAIGT